MQRVLVANMLCRRCHLPQALYGIAIPGGYLHVCRDCVPGPARDHFSLPADTAADKGAA